MPVSALRAVLTNYRGSVAWVASGNDRNTTTVAVTGENTGST